jgi:hypothetical protein
MNGPSQLRHSAFPSVQPRYCRLIDPEQGGDSALRIASGEPL